MKEGKIEILDLDFEYKLWKNKLCCYNKEIELMKHRIESLKQEHPGFNINKKNITILETQLKAVEQVKNRIKTMEQEMAYYAVDYPILTRHSHYVEHEKIRLEMENVYKNHNLIFDQIYPLLCYPLNFSNI